MRHCECRRFGLRQSLSEIELNKVIANADTSACGNLYYKLRSNVSSRPFGIHYYILRPIICFAVLAEGIMYENNRKKENGWGE